MKRIAITVAAASLAVSAQAAGTVQCNFVNPERFADVRDRSYSAEHNLKTLQDIVVSVAAPYVLDGQTLKVDVLDVDLAGEVRPGARAWDVRVLRGSADWPRITLRWSLEGAGQASRSGEAVVQDMAYLTRIASPLASTSLIYERRMLAEWFKTQFGKPAG
jgi:Protein of unknown function (DUF3016)